MSKVAIIEDDVAIAEMYRMKFENDGFEVATAEDGQQGLELITSFKPDIVLLDLMMPVMDGKEMLEKLRQTPEGQKTKVIILTNMGDESSAQNMQKFSPIDYIVKAAMTPKQVSQRVKEIIQSASSGGLALA